MAPPAAPIAALHARLRRRAPLRSHTTQARLRRPHDAPPECKGRYLAWAPGAAPGSVICRSPRVPTPRAREINRGRKHPGVRLATLRRPPQSMPRSIVKKHVSVESLGKNTPQLTKHPRPMQRSPSAAQPTLAICQEPASPSAAQPTLAICRKPAKRLVRTCAIHCRTDRLAGFQHNRVTIPLRPLGLQAFSIIALPTLCGQWAALHIPPTQIKHVSVECRGR